MEAETMAYIHTHTHTLPLCPSWLLLVTLACCYDCLGFFYIFLIFFLSD